LLRERFIREKRVSDSLMRRWIDWVGVAAGETPLFIAEPEFTHGCDDCGFDLDMLRYASTNVRNGLKNRKRQSVGLAEPYTGRSQHVGNLQPRPVCLFECKRSNVGALLGGFGIGSANVDLGIDLGELLVSDPFLGNGESGAHFSSVSTLFRGLSGFVGYQPSPEEQRNLQRSDDRADDDERLRVRRNRPVYVYVFVAYGVFATEGFGFWLIWWRGWRRTGAALVGLSLCSLAWWVTWVIASL
jgi:hypothetical protein